MSTAIISKFFFIVTFPALNRGRSHVPSARLHCLARKQLADLDVIETIDHLFQCQRCFEQYRLIRTAYLPTV